MQKISYIAVVPQVEWNQRMDVPAPPSGPVVFATTHWGMVLAAGDSCAPAADAALDQLCRTYWSPVYAFVRCRGHAEADARDLTQEFFRRLLEKKYLKRANPERGRFRSFLISALKHFLINEWAAAQTARRGGGQTVLSWDAETAEAQFQHDAATSLSPEKAYEKQWAIALLHTVLTRLEKEAEAEGKAGAFELMKDFLWGEAKHGSYDALAARLNSNANAVRVAVHRLRKRYGQLLCDEIAQTVNDPAEVEEEIRYLFRAVG
jgi:RNA polymerase sigma-70 factor (ECF subfamily)